MESMLEDTQNENCESLSHQAPNRLLRFITCGSVDDGKSTLIGRLLFETEMIFENELISLKKDSLKYSTTGEAIDFSLLVDGLSSEREQGITIDVAYRFFATQSRKFIVADTPGHEQYTRNMATGASTADLAIVLIDARKGVLNQTKRHSFIVSMLGVKHVVVAVNKMDLVDYDESVFTLISEAYQTFAQQTHFEKIDIVPISALTGENICYKGESTSWYKGCVLLEILEKAEVYQDNASEDFCLPVQWVNRPNLDFRGFTGRVENGVVSVGDKIKVLPSGMESRIKRIVNYKKDDKTTQKGESTTLILHDEIDISRGDVITSPHSACEVANHFQTTLLWMSDKVLIRGRQYILKCATQTALCTPNTPKYRIDINTMEHMAAATLSLNEIGVCDISLNKDIVVDKYAHNKTMGSFILIDRMSNETVACGWINFALRRSANIHKQHLEVDKASRGDIKSHQSAVVWFTGLSGSGKSTIANELEVQLNKKVIHTVLLDGDNLRHGLNKDLGFTERDRAENIRRVAEVAKLMTEAGLICLVSFISPFAAERRMAKELVGGDSFFEIYIDTPIEVAEKRDKKGLYAKARRGEIKNFTGIDSPYEVPVAPTHVINTQEISAEQAASEIMDILIQKGIFD